MRRQFGEHPSLVARLENSRNEDENGNVFWTPEMDRVKNVILKLARGHAAFEDAEPKLDEPERLIATPFWGMAEEGREEFEAADTVQLWPEIGSRGFIARAKGIPGATGWKNVQDGRYRYLVSRSDRFMVRIVLSEYLACEVVW